MYLKLIKKEKYESTYSKSLFNVGLFLKLICEKTQGS